MSDFIDAPKTADPQRDAVAQIIRRIQNDADLAYLIGWGTTSYQRLVAAEVAATGCAQQEAEQRVRYTGNREPRVVELQNRVERLERLADEYETRSRARGVPLLCRDCSGDGVVNGNECDACGGEHDAIRKANSALIAAAPDLAASVVHHAQRADALLEVLRLIAPRCRQEDCESYATRGQRHFDSETFRCDEHGGTLPELKHVAVLRLLNGGAS